MTGSEDTDTDNDSSPDTAGSDSRGGHTTECPLVINELLCFVIQKLDLLPPDSIVQLCKSYYDKKSIWSAKNELFEAVNRPDLCRLVKRKGPNAPVEDLKDVLKLLQMSPKVPVRYVAGDLSRLPPITFNDIDVSTLLAKMEGMQAEVRLLKETQQAQALLVSDLKDAACSITVPGPSALPSPVQSTAFSDALKQMAASFI